MRSGEHNRAIEIADEQEQLAALPRLGRLGRRGDVAGVVSFPAGRWVNGQVVYANGGFV